MGVQRGYQPTYLHVVQFLSMPLFYDRTLCIKIKNQFLIQIPRKESKKSIGNGKGFDIFMNKPRSFNCASQLFFYTKKAFELKDYINPYSRTKIV